MTIERVLLGFLNQRPTHGYEIYQQLSERTGLGLIWRVKQGRLYALLERLEAEGYIEATLEQQEARPPRKVLRLTEVGHCAYRTWVETPVPHGREMRQDFLAKLYFAERESPAHAHELVENQRDTSNKWLSTLHAQELRAAEVGASGRYDWLVCRYRIGQVEAMLRWLDTCEQALAEAQGWPEYALTEVG